MVTRNKKSIMYLCITLVITILFTALSAGIPLHVSAADQYDTLRLRYKDALTGGTNYNASDPDIADKISSITTSAQGYWDTINKSSGRTYLWGDLPNDDIYDTQSSYDRLNVMALAFATYGSSLYNNSTLGSDIAAAMDWMHQNRYNTGKVNTFWFRFEISVPKKVENIVVLIYDKLTTTQINNYMSVIDHFSPDPNKTGNDTATGANRVDKCLVVGLRGIIGKSSSKIGAARDAISPVLDYVTTGDGFYQDGSFIQHSDIPYTGSYGVELISGLGTFLSMVSDSSWEVTDPDISNVYTWIYDSYEPFVYNGLFMDSVRGRAISRYNSPDYTTGKGFTVALLQIAQFAPSQDANAYRRMIKQWVSANIFDNFYTGLSISNIVKIKAIMNDANITPRGELVKHKQYPSMARAVHLRPGFGFGISMFSNSISNYETTNNENVKSWYTAEGMTYLYNNDLKQFNDNFWCTVDMKRLPGITIDAGLPRPDKSGSKYQNPQDWVGGVEINGLYGVNGMQLDGWNSTLLARKSWFMFDDEIVALGSHINSTDSRTIETVIENRKINSSGNNAFTVNGNTKSTALGWSENMTGVSWAHLAGNEPNSDIGYYFPNPSAVKAKREARTGTWQDVNPYIYTTTPYTRNYLTLWFDHGINPVNKDYAYVLLPNKTSSQVSSYANNPNVTILENSPYIQAVKENSLNIIGANFWRNETRTVDIITSHKKASVMFKETASEIEIAVSDPTRTNTGTIEMEINRSASQAISIDGGIIITEMSPKIKFTVNVNGAGGKTFKMKFTKGTPQQSVIQPSADAYVRSGAYANTNYGSDTMIHLKDTTGVDVKRRGYIKFSLSAYKSVNSAKLRIYGNAVSNATCKVYGLDNDAWTESGITWNNAPIPDGFSLGTVIVTPTAKYYEFDVTGYIQNQLAGDKVVSLYMRGFNEEDITISFNSRNNTLNKPELVILGK